MIQEIQFYSNQIKKILKYLNNWISFKYMQKLNIYSWLEVAGSLTMYCSWIGQ
jgi:hypothetical protein